MIIRNVQLYSSSFRFVQGELYIRDGRIVRVITDSAPQAEERADPSEAGQPAGKKVHPMDNMAKGAGEKVHPMENAAQPAENEPCADPVIDGSGCYAIPGLIDIHFHGCMGMDFCDGTAQAVQTLAEYEVQHGITAICPATLTLPVEQLCHVLRTGAAFARDQKARAVPAERMQADLVGVNMEGPFISHIKKGAQNEAYIIPWNTDICEQFLRSGEGLLKIIGLAPEENPGFAAGIRELKDRVRISLAHSNADYDTAMEAYHAGASHAVHLFNAMPEFTHRAPGIVGAVADSPHVTAELICDGNHVHPSVVRAAFQIIGPERLALISDSLRSAGLGDGIMDLGGQSVKVEGTKATLVEGGNLAGSVTNLMDCMRIAVKQMGIPLEQAVRCASANPAKVIGEDRERGSLEPGKRADIVLLDREDLSVKYVIKDGKLL